MAAVLFALMCVAIAGLLASLIVHVASLFGMALTLLDSFMFPGLLIVWIATIVVSTKLSEDYPRKDLWKASLRGAPSWVGKALYGTFMYAILNFILVWFAPENAVTHTRGISGHAIAFYSVASGVLFSAWRLRTGRTQRLCAQGHVVDSAEEFCPKCGSPLVNELPRPAG